MDTLLDDPADALLTELMQEVRVVQTGVQVLFGFLLAPRSGWQPPARAPCRRAVVLVPGAPASAPVAAPVLITWR